MDSPKHKVGWFRKLWWRINAHIIQPFLESHSPLHQVAWGASIGMFVTLTPTVGIQMYIASLIWLFCRYILRVRFSLSIAIALVWISNPFTMGPLYYLYLKTGDLIYMQMGKEVTEMSFALFHERLHDLTNQSDGNMLEWLYNATMMIFVEFGEPMLVGAMAYAIPISIGSYPFTMVLLGRYRRRLAEDAGMSYKDWREKFEQ